jgi:hypothetical protein
MTDERDCLKGIEQVAWDKLQHGQGHASDVPRLLRDLLSSDKEVRKNSRWELHGNLWHQTTVYGATLAAIPFLARLAADPATPERAHLLLYLALLYLGTSDQPGLVEAVCKAIDDQIPAMVPLLRCEESSIRVATAYLVGLSRINELGEDVETITYEEIVRASVGEAGL